MKKLVGLSLTLIICLFCAGQQPCAHAHHVVEVEIVGLRNDHGHILLQLMSEDEVIDEKVMEIKDGKSSGSFDYLFQGTYHIRFFHDEDEDGVMSKNIFGIPKEGYGFSNNARGFMGPPDREDTEFKVEHAILKQRLSAVYH